MENQQKTQYSTHYLKSETNPTHLYNTINNTYMDEVGKETTFISSNIILIHNDINP